MKKAKIITFEGIDQSGKETQSKLLRNRLKEIGFKVGHLYFPDYETPIGKELNNFLSGEKEYSPIVRQLLYAANRYEKINVINEMLKENDFLVIDRYISSGISYGVVNGIEAEWSINLESKLPQPDTIILLDISSETSRNRKSEDKRDVYEKKLDFLDQVRTVYLEQARKNSWIIVDASKSMIEVHEKVWSELIKYIDIANIY